MNTEDLEQECRDFKNWLRIQQRTISRYERALRWIAESGIDDAPEVARRVLDIQLQETPAKALEALELLEKEGRV